MATWYMLLIITYHALRLNAADLYTAEMSRCNLNNDLWTIYARHFYIAQTIVIKILHQTNGDQRNVDRFSNMVIKQLYNELSKKALIERYQLETSVAVAEVEDYYTANEVMDDDGLIKVPFNESLKEAYELLWSASDPMKVYVVIVPDEVVLKHYIEQTPNIVVSEPNALYIIAYVGYQRKLGIDVSKCAADNLEKLWKQYYVLNVVSQYPCSDQWGNHFYIYRPFIKVGENSWGAVVTHKMEDVLLDHRMIVNSLRQLNEFPLRVTLFERPSTLMSYVTKGLAESPVYQNDQWYYGMDGRVFVTFKKYLNFKIVLDNSSSYYGYAFGSGNITDTLGKIVRQEAEFAANSRFLEYYGPANYEYTTVITDDEICVIVPKAPKMPTWKSMMHCFKGTVWLANFLIIVICSLFLRYLRKKTSWLEMYSIFFSVPVNFKRTSRLFLGACMFYNIIIAGIFQGNFVSIFTHTRYSKDINTLEELDASGLMIMTTLYPLFERNKTIFQRLLKKVIANPTDRPAIELAALYKKVAAVERKSDAKLFVSQFTTSHGDPLLHIVNECLKTSFVTYVMFKDSPLSVVMNKFLRKIVEGGFIEKWKYDVIDAIVTKKQQEAVARDSPRILHITDVHIAFYFLFIGYCLGLISFAIEKYLFFKSCRKLQRHFML